MLSSIAQNHGVRDVSPQIDSLNVTDTHLIEESSLADVDSGMVIVDSIIHYSRTLAIEILAWPFENLVEPLVTVAIAPIRPPMNYVFQEKIINKAIDLVTFGPRENLIITPVAKIMSGPGSLIGFSYRHFRLMGDDHHDALRLNYAKYLNGDWRMRAKYKRSKLFGSKAGFFVEFKVNNKKGDTFLYPGTDKEYIFGDSTFGFRAEISYPVIAGWGLNVQIAQEHPEYYDPFYGTNTPAIQREQTPQSLVNRGFPHNDYRKYKIHNYYVALGKSTKDSQHMPTRGYNLHFGYGYVDVQNKSDIIVKDLNNNTHSVNMKFQKFLLLGETEYGLSNNEDKENVRFLKNLNVSNLLDIFKVERLEKNFLQRKVLVFQWKMRQMLEVESGNGFFKGYSSISNETPLRAYGRAGVDKAFMAASMEYRFPLIRLMAGTFFVDFASVAPTLYSADQLWNDNLRSSFGIGLRMRKSNLFLTRVQFAISGSLNVFSLNLTVSPAY
ncbi:MAG: hypothetical protein OCC49_04985 [Fibrobacterales bacterium]